MTSYLNMDSFSFCNLLNGLDTPQRREVYRAIRSEVVSPESYADFDRVVQNELQKFDFAPGVHASWKFVIAAMTLGRAVLAEADEEIRAEDEAKDDAEFPRYGDPRM